MAKLLAKILAGFLWVLAFGIITLPGTAQAFFGDQETGDSNLLQAGVLDFYLQSSSDFSPEITPSQVSTRDIQIFNTANPFKYTIQAENISGDLCSYINLRAYLNGNLVCSGPLLAFTCTNLTFETTDPNPSQWHFVANLTSEEAPKNSQCQFKLSFFARQINLESGGFHDEEDILNTIISGDWQPPSPQILITKVYYDADSDHGSEVSNEWIELYNPNTDPVDISDWILEDNQAQDIIPSSTIIPAQGFLLIAASNDTWSYWKNIPSTVPKIVLSDGSIGDGLDNDGDRIILKDKNGAQIDALSYEQDISVFDPAAPLDAPNNTYDLPEGQLLARVPIDLDTDTANDWKGLELPNVDIISPSGGTWYCSQTVNLQWSATNPNGSNDDLSITLQYIRDLDDNGTVSDGDAVTTIAQNIPNTGSYIWQVSPCYYGYVWIRVIAQGEENFMVHNDGLSGRVFEPLQSSSGSPSELQSSEQQSSPEGENGENLDTSQDTEETSDSNQEQSSETNTEETNTEIDDSTNENLDQPQDQPQDPPQNQEQNQGQSQESAQEPEQDINQPQSQEQNSQETNDFQNQTPQDQSDTPNDSSPPQDLSNPPQE